MRDFFALDDPWVRPGGGIHRRDVILSVTVAAVSLIILEMVRSLGTLDSEGALARWQQWALTVLPAVPLLTLRRWPLASAVVGSVAFLVVGTLAPIFAQLLTTQVVFFLLIFGAVAWARSRTSMALVVGLIVAAMFLWLGWYFAVGNALTELGDPPRVESAWVPPFVALLATTLIVDIVYFGGAVILGQLSWRAARQRAGLEEQAATIARQSAELRESAVVDERLRIARELHDVVAHHVSGMGVQAAAARRVITRDTGQAEQALARIEGASREAVSQMRQLLGTLRAAQGEAEGLAPQPGLGDLDDLVRQRREQGLEVDLSVVQEAAGDLDRVPPAVGHSLFRTAQEALTNVSRHSSAKRAKVAVRIDSGHAEVEVTDAGRSIPGNAGTGLGHIGMRERADSHHGTLEVGPREVGGYRVRLSIPLDDETSAIPPSTPTIGA